VSLPEQIARWREKLAGQVTVDRTEGWVERAFDEAGKAASKHLGAATGDVVAEALDALRPVAPAFARRGV
jgi:hypothetical protein